MASTELKPAFSAWILTLIAILFVALVSAKPGSLRPRRYLLQDTTVNESDTLIREEDDTVYTPSRRPNLNPRDRFGDPFSNFTGRSPLFLRDPSSLKLDLEIDTGMNYTIYEKIGDLNYRPTSSMTFEEFKQYREKENQKDYWKTRSAGLDGESALSGRNLIPPIYISPIFDRIFGGSYVEIIPRGFVTLDFGGRWQRINNPAIPIRQQKNGGFEFDQQISMNVTGKIGEKMAVTANFDNNNSFDFQNNLKVEYTGFEEDILQKLEIGNVSLPLNNSLITGAQNLFGVKGQLQFGKLYVTAVASTQRGKSETLEIDGSAGGANREFEIIASNYDENRHFFLGHFFRQNYERWLGTLPQVNTGVNVRRVEVYVVNRQQDTQTLRNVVGLMDLGEGGPDLFRDFIGPISPVTPPNDNDANPLFQRLLDLSDNDKNSDNIIEVLANLYGPDQLLDGTDFFKINGARKLEEGKEFTFNPELGYITLTRKLQNDEALAVAYEYTFRGEILKVGELSEDYGPRPEDQVAFLKLLRPNKINIRDENGRRIPTWDLMMKNVYSLNANQVEREGFQLRVIYRDIRTGVDNPQLQEPANGPNRQLVEILGLDRLNPNGDPQPDGNFDYAEGLTIIPDRGLVILPTLAPFGNTLREAIESDYPPEQQQSLITKYVYDTLYNTTKADAELVADLNKFFLTGLYTAGTAGEIIIPGFNIAEGSVRVFAGGSPLIEGQDYTVDYNFGKVTIINEGVLNSGKNLTINYEKADLFNFQSRTLLGTRLDYRLSEDVNFGGTLLYLNERPLISRISIGNEPIRNTKYGFDVNVQKESRILTKAIDALPLIQTKEPSSVTFNAEFAQLIPGTSNIVDGEGTSYIDDFENTVTPFSLTSPQSWSLAATPRTDDNRFFGNNASRNEVVSGFKRAKLAWYQVDNLFYTTGRQNKPDHLTDEDLQNHYVRRVQTQEIFPGFNPNVVNTNEPILDLAYYPEERGPYNYNPDLELQDGNAFLPQPASNWGGITNAIRNEVDFDKSNIEYIEFWLLDPFIDSPNGFGEIDDGTGRGDVRDQQGGSIFFNLGNISEDVIPDNRHGFENGLPPDGEINEGENVERTAWGYVTQQQFLTNAFDNEPASRGNQDVGLDGARSDQEVDLFGDYLNSLQGDVRTSVEEDPSADDFRYFLGSEFDAARANILVRYKDFNGLENNSPIPQGQSFTPSNNQLPDNEDLNQDNTLSEQEEYYEYEVPITPTNLNVTNNEFIVDRVTTSDNVAGEVVNWYLFRVPIRQNFRTFGNINGFKSIRYLRTYLTGWEKPVVLRMANFRLVGSKWRRFLGNLEGKNFDLGKERNLDNFTISAVNIEENGQPNDSQPAYSLPPGFRRDRDNTAAVERSLNEQSIQVCIDDLEDGDARAIYKNVVLDLVNYGRVKMFLSANSPDAESSDSLKAFFRIAADLDSNYYEIEIPLTITPPNATDSRAIWPEENEIDVAFQDLYALKAERDRLRISRNEIYPSGGRRVGRHTIRVKGSPKLSNAAILMIGVRNPRDDGAPKSVCIWANELRVTDFDRTKGWAANATLNAKLADFINVTGTVQHSTIGFGGIQSRISERSREETTSFDVSANVTLDKLLPEKSGLKIPMYVSYQKSTSTPQFDPRDPDLPLDAAIQSFQDEEEREDFKRIVQDREERRSINFTNVRKVKTNPEAKKRIYDIENFSVTYAYSEVVQSDFKTAEFFRQNYRGALAYNYNPDVTPWEPFSKSKAFKSPYLKLLKDFNFNPLPSNLSARFDLDRQFTRRRYRNDVNGRLVEDSEAFYEKYFYFDRTYNLRWDLSKGLSLNYNARANAIIDEPEGELNTEEARDSVLTNLFNFGRMVNFDQNIGINYTLPLDKIPFTDWLNVDYGYDAGYSWRAGPVVIDSATRAQDLGNIIQNNRTQNVTGKFDLVKLYNKVKILKEINSPPRRRGGRRSQQVDTVQTKDNKGLKKILRFLMGVRSINFTYNVTEGTLLPGFTPRPYLFGLDSGFNAPGLGFVFGSQDPGIRQRAADNDWLTKNPDLTTPFTQSRATDLNLRALVEPLKDFKIQLDAKKTEVTEFQETFRFDTTLSVQDYRGFTPGNSGSYSVTFLSILTAFSGDDDQNNSKVFEDFERNRDIIWNRLTGNNTESTIPYDTNSQDVLIPAFIAAYTGKDPNKVSLSPFPRTPLPNWRIDFAGLGKLDAFKDVFQSINITHAYTSRYSVTNYISNSLYDEGISISDNVEDYNRTRFANVENQNGSLAPIYTITQVLISEQFSPLIGINVRTKSRVTARAEYKTKRDLSLNINNAQVTEVNNKDLTFELGFTKTDMKLPFKSRGRTIVLKNDLTFRLSFTINDTRTVQRKIAEGSTVTNGNINYRFRPNFNYALNQRLNLQVYFERNINEPRVSNSFPRATTRFGAQLRFSLTQ